MKRPTALVRAQRRDATPPSDDQNIRQDSKLRRCPTCKRNLPFEHFLGERGDLEWVRSCIQDRAVSGMHRDYRNYMSQQMTVEQARGKLIKRATNKIQDWDAKAREHGVRDDDSQSILTACQQKIDIVVAQYSNLQYSTATPTEAQTLPKARLVLKLKIPQQGIDDNTKVPASSMHDAHKETLREKPSPMSASKDATGPKKQKAIEVFAGSTHDTARPNLRESRPRSSTSRETARAKKQKIIDAAREVFGRESAAGRTLCDAMVANRKNISSMINQAKELENKIARAKAQEDRDDKEYDRIRRSAAEAWEVIKPRK